MNLRHPRNIYPRMTDMVQHDRSDYEYGLRRRAERRGNLLMTLLVIGAIVIAVALYRLYLNR